MPCGHDVITTENKTQVSLREKANVVSLRVSFTLLHMSERVLFAD